VRSRDSELGTKRSGEGALHGTEGASDGDLSDLQVGRSQEAFGRFELPPPHGVKQLLSRNFRDGPAECGAVLCQSQGKLLRHGERLSFRAVTEILRHGEVVVPQYGGMQPVAIFI
jgi:hypothetical protein